MYFKITYYAIFANFIPVKLGEQKQTKTHLCDAQKALAANKSCTMLLRAFLPRCSSH